MRLCAQDCDRVSEGHTGCDEYPHPGCQEQTVNTFFSHQETIPTEAQNIYATVRKLFIHESCPWHYFLSGALSYTCSITNSIGRRYNGLIPLSDGTIPAP